MKVWEEYAIMEEVERLKISLGNIDRFEQDVSKLKCKYTRVSLLGACAWTFRCLWNCRGR